MTPPGHGDIPGYPTMEQECGNTRPWSRSEVIPDQDSSNVSNTDQDNSNVSNTDQGAGMVQGGIPGSRNDAGRIPGYCTPLPCTPLPYHPGYTLHVHILPCTRAGLVVHAQVAALRRAVAE